MAISKEAAEISLITRMELGLLYKLPSEVQSAIDDNRSVIFYRHDRPAAFCLWHFWDNWCEITSLYIHPDLRSSGLLGRVYKELHRKLGTAINNAFIFTRHPVVANLVRKSGFKAAKIWELPLPIIWKLIFHRLHPARMVSYWKFGPKIFSLRFRLFILENTP